MFFLRDIKDIIFFVLLGCKRILGYFWDFYFECIGLWDCLIFMYLLIFMFYVSIEIVRISILLSNLFYLVFKGYFGVKSKVC